MIITDQDAATAIVLDFETTGLSPDQGERAIEIGAVKIVDGEVVDTFQQLMYPGRRINSFTKTIPALQIACLKMRRLALK